VIKDLKIYKYNGDWLGPSKEEKAGTIFPLSKTNIMEMLHTLMFIFYIRNKNHAHPFIIFTAIIIPQPLYSILLPIQTYLLGHLVDEYRY
jgi:ACR3 family arsenite efflux pump ArsB